MTSVSTRPFNPRAFAAVTAALAGLGLPLTGYMNHVYQFAPLTPARHAWMAAHNILALVFAVFALWHVALNRQALRRHLKGGLQKLAGIPREVVTAFLLVSGLVFLFVAHALHTG